MELKSLYFNLVYVFFFSAKTRIYINKTYTNWSWKLFISSLSDIFSFLSRGNESLVIFTRCLSGNYASSQAQSWIQISSLVFLLLAIMSRVFNWSLLSYLFYNNTSRLLPWGFSCRTNLYSTLRLWTRIITKLTTRENDKTSIVFHFLEIERRKQFCNSQTSLQLDSTCMFGAMF